MNIEKCSFCGNAHEKMEARPLRTPTLNPDKVLCDRTYICPKYPKPIVLIPREAA